ncbi:adrenocorticotropic hormone receptor-like [Montipora foliosa]|uniref:adrenocorticotropic hormone receptor-like n=1 Tax=Montipora foliosa TaxID=591990 RepID=UPI0035F1250C
MLTFCVFSAVVAGVFSLCAMASNGVALYIVYKDPLNFFRRKSITVLMASLAVNDFLTGSVVSLFRILRDIACDSARIRNPPFAGSFENIIGVFAHNNGTLLIVGLSAERLIAVALPFYYRATASSRKTLVCVVCLTTYSFVFSLLQLSGIPPGIYRTLQLHLNMTFPLFAVFALNFSLLLILRKHRRRSCSKTPHPKDNHFAAANEHRFDITFTAILIVLLLFLSLAPYYVMTLIEFHCSQCIRSTWFVPCRQISLLFRFIHCACNPFTYSFRIRECRQSFKALFSKSQRTGELSSKDSQVLSPTPSTIFLRRMSRKSGKTGEVIEEFVEENLPDALASGLVNMTTDDLDVQADKTDHKEVQKDQRLRTESTSNVSGRSNEISFKELEHNYDTKL